MAFGRVLDKPVLDADLYVEDNPSMCDWCLDAGKPVLIRRLPWNGNQCERAGQSDMRAAVFDDWSEIPELARQLLEEGADR